MFLSLDSRPDDAANSFATTAVDRARGRGGRSRTRRRHGLVVVLAAVRAMRPAQPVDLDAARASAGPLPRSRDRGLSDEARSLGKTGPGRRGRPGLARRSGLRPLKAAVRRRTEGARP